MLLTKSDANLGFGFGWYFCHETAAGPCCEEQEHLSNSRALQWRGARVARSDGCSYSPSIRVERASVAMCLDGRKKRMREWEREIWWVIWLVAYIFPFLEREMKFGSIIACEWAAFTLMYIANYITLRYRKCESLVLTRISCFFLLLLPHLMNVLSWSPFWLMFYPQGEVLCNALSLNQSD